MDPHAVRVACLALLGTYGLVALVRHDPDHLGVAAVRAAVCMYALGGVLAARRFTWGALRAYTGILPPLLSFAAAFAGAAEGNRLPDLALTALATFAPLPFVLTAADLGVTAAVLAAGHAASLLVVSESAVPPLTVAIVVGGAIATGAAAALTMIITRATLRESTTWWQQACERERALREFGVATATLLRSPALLDRLAEHFAHAFGGGGCSILLAHDGGPFTVRGVAGFDPERTEALRSEALSPRTNTLVHQVVAARRSVVRPVLGDDARAAMARRRGQPVAARSLVALPVVVEDVVAGVVVVTAREPRPVDPSTLQLLEAMASQLGVAVADARLLERLERALRAKSEFLNTMSHELRSPLHVIVGYADMLRDRDAGPSPEEAGDRIRASALELLRLVEDTMTASQLEAGRLPVRSDEFEAGTLVAELAEGVRALPEAKGPARVRWETTPDLPPLRLDRLKVKEIVQNLVSNALKFTPEGEVRVCLRRDADWLAIVVEDTGIGIPAEAHARIFEMFERVDPGDRGRPPGVGLGLYIVGRLVHLMHGAVAVESAPGRGSRFTVRLPLRLDRAAA